MEQEKFYGLVNALLSGAAYGVLLVASALLVYAVYNTVKICRRRMKAKKARKGQFRRGSEIATYNLLKSIHSNNLPRHNDQSSGRDFKWGSGVFRIKKP